MSFPLLRASSACGALGKLILERFCYKAHCEAAPKARHPASVHRMVRTLEKRVPPQLRHIEAVFFAKTMTSLRQALLFGVERALPAKAFFLASWSEGG